MPPGTIDFIPTSYVLTPPVYGELSEKVIPHPTIVFGEYKQDTPQYGFLTEKVLYHPSVETSTFSPPVPAWGELVDVSPQIDDTTPDPIQAPYVEASELSPADGSIEVATSTNVVIPCGDLITRELKASLFNLLKDESQDAILIGLDPMKTVILVSQEDGEEGDPIYENGAAVGSWIVSVVQNDFSGYERDLVAGYTYTITPPGGWNPGAHVVFTIYLEGYGGEYGTFTYDFFTRNVSPVKTTGIFVVCNDIIEIELSSDVVTDTNMFDSSNYQCVNLSGGPSPTIEMVLPRYLENVTSKIYFKINNLILGHQYRFVILEQKIYDREGAKVAASVFNWTMHRTKSDSAIGSIARVFDTGIGANLRSVLEAVTVSDEKIGGDF